MNKKGRPKQDKEIPLMERDLQFESLRYKLNVVGYEMHLDMQNRIRLTKAIRDLSTLALGERYSEYKAEELAKKILKEI